MGNVDYFPSTLRVVWLNDHHLDM